MWTCKHSVATFPCTKSSNKRKTQTLKSQKKSFDFFFLCLLILNCHERCQAIFWFWNFPVMWGFNEHPPPQFPSRQFMIMKWSCLTGYQNFMESRPPSFSPCSLILIQAQHQRTGVAMIPWAVWELLTDTWLCPLVWKTRATAHTKYYLCKSYDCMTAGFCKNLSFFFFFHFWRVLSCRFLTKHNRFQLIYK